MLTAAENERLTQVGQGTPMGELLRRYWHPVAAVSQLDERPTQAVRILGEDLVLYRDADGGYGLVGPRCAHRGVSLLYGMREADGIRCPYHGWKFDKAGACVEQPFDDTVGASSLHSRERAAIAGYPVQELGGLVWAYLGPQPAPALPRWDLLVRDDLFRHVGIAEVPCNWLQIMENSLDPVHLEWLHGWYSQYVLAQRGEEVPLAERLLRRHQKVGFDVFDYGIIKRRVVEGRTEEHEDWRVGHPIVFPNILRVGGTGRYEFEFRVPMDDTHTLHYWYTCYGLPPGAEVPHYLNPPYYHVPITDEHGWHIVDFVDGQDLMAWVTQGPIADREVEHLGASDTGIALFRRLLRENMDRIAAGDDPMNVFRGPGSDRVLEIAQEERGEYGRLTPETVTRFQARYSPAAEELVRAFTRVAVPATA